MAYPSLASSEHTNSMLSGLFNGFYGFGQALGPLLGSYLYEATGENFRLTMNIVGGICLVFSLLYFCFANGCQAFNQSCKNRRNKGELLTAENRK